MPWITWLLDFFKAIAAPGAAQDPDTRRWSLRLAGIATAATILLILFAGGSAASLKASPDQASWEIALLARTTLVRLALGLAVFLMAVVLAFLVMGALDNTRIGKWLWHWSQADHYQDGDANAVKAAKTLGHSIVFGALLLGALMFFSAVLK